MLSREGVGDLAARAYAATALGDQIRHYRTETDFVSGTHRSSSFSEAWQYAEEVHWIVGGSLNPGSTFEHYLGKDDVVRTTIHQPGKPDQHQTMTPEFSAEARDIIDGMQGSFVERFRSFYREDRIRDAGPHDVRRPSGSALRRGAAGRLHLGVLHRRGDRAPPGPGGARPGSAPDRARDRPGGAAAHPAEPHQGASSVVRQRPSERTRAWSEARPECWS